jgi:hypothetical protein
LHPSFTAGAFAASITASLKLLDDRSGGALGQEEGVPGDRFEIDQALLVRGCKGRQ